jgi:antitoxin PrlF
MKIAESRLTRQGQISVPAEVRRRLGLQPGSVLEWEAEGDTVIVRRAGHHSSAAIHEALFPAPPERKSLEELKEGVRRHAKVRRDRKLARLDGAQKL